MRLINLIYFLFIFIAYSIPKETPKELREDFIKESYKQYKIKELKNSEFSVQNLMEYMSIIEVQNKEIVFKQIVLETGWFKSSLFTKHNNLFGMMYHKRCRKTTAIGVAFIYMKDYGDRIIIYHPSKYNHWTDSVDDYLLFIKYWENRGKSVENYYDFLHKIGYAYEGDYIKILKKLDISKYLKVPSIKENLNI